MMNNDNLNSPVIPRVLIIAAFVIIFAAIMQAVAIINPILMSLFVSIVCAQPIIWLKRKKLPMFVAITIVFVGITGLFLGFGELIATSLSSFSEDAPKYEENLLDMGKSLTHYFAERGINISTDKMSKIFEPEKVMGVTASILGQLGGFMGNALTIFFLALFLLMEMDSIPVKSRAILKNSSKSLHYFIKIGSNIRHYLSIKTATSLLTGVSIWILLAILGVDYAIIWALIAFLLNFIPNIGSILAAFPAILFALVQLGTGAAFWTMIIFVAVNMIVGNIVEPKVMGKGLGLSTYVVFVSLIFWGFVLGVVGMFLSVPLTMAIKIMLEQDPKTKWIAITLGTQGEAEAILNEKEEDQEVL